MTSSRLYTQRAGTALLLATTIPAPLAFAQTTSAAIENRDTTAGTPGNSTGYATITGLTGNGTTVGGSNTRLTGTSYQSTASSGLVSGTSTTPGLPNTGAGGDAVSVWTILLVSLGVFFGGSALLARKVAF